MPIAPNKTSTEKREAKRLDVIRIASLKMNERGATSINLSDVAKGAGLSRNALYYYFKDRLDLIYACYLYASEAAEADLRIVQDDSSGALQKLSAYIERTLLGGSAERAVLTDVDLLPEPHRQVVCGVHERTIQLLESIIKQGMDSGEIRKVDAKVTAQVIQGLLSWAQLWYRWADLEESKLKNHYALAANGITQVIFYGISANRELQFKCDLQLPLLTARQVNTFDSKSLHQEKRFQLIGAASLLFNCKGVDAVSLDDIADYIGATKGAVYHYFKDKQALIKACFLQAFDQYDKIADIASKSNLDPMSQLLVVLHLNCQAQMSKTPPLILQGSTSPFALKYADRSRAIASKLDDIRSTAISAGLHGNADKNIISLTPGAFFWIPRWYAKQSQISEIDLADEICKIMSTGIAMDNITQGT
jgi:AcrR family transcriptional regulator